MIKLHLSFKKNFSNIYICMIYTINSHTTYMHVALLATMPCWFYEKHELQNSPSIVEGITLNEERAFRVDGARFIMRAGSNLGLSSETSATGVVYFHRFYMKHAFQSYPRYVSTTNPVMVLQRP